jgi:hypothetical protein
MKTLSPLFALLPLIYSSLVLSRQADHGCPRYAVYGVPASWETYISNYTHFSSQPGWTPDDTLDPALVVTDEPLNYLNALPAQGPFATSRDDFIRKVEKGLQFPYRDYVGQIKYSYYPAADDQPCEHLWIWFTATAKTIKTRYVK